MAIYTGILIVPRNTFSRIRTTRTSHIMIRWD